MKTITVANVSELEKWLDNMREALIAQAERGAEIIIKNGSREVGIRRVADWQISVIGVRNEEGVEADELMCLS